MLWNMFIVWLYIINFSQLCNNYLCSSARDIAILYLIVCHNVKTEILNYISLMETYKSLHAMKYVYSLTL